MAVQTVFDLVRKAAARAPSAPAVVDSLSGEVLSYYELLAAVGAMAGGFLASGLRRGDRVAVVSPNSVEACIAILALHRAGLVPAMLNPRLKPDELAALIHDGGMAGCVIAASLPFAEPLRARLSAAILTFGLDGALEKGPTVAELLSHGREPPAFTPAPEEPALIFYTSGTTGLPKGVVIPHRASEPRMLFMCTQCGLTFGSHNRSAGVLPLCHVVGFYAVFVATLALNGTYFLFRAYEPRHLLTSIARYRMTNLFATPTHLDAMIGAMQPDDNLSSLDVVIFAGATMPDAVLRRVNLKLPGRKINIYGTTEAMNSLFMLGPTVGTRMRPGFYSEVRIIGVGGLVSESMPPGEDGELIVSSDNDAVFTEYLGRPDATSERLAEGWYRTGDAAAMHSDGEIEIKGRLDDTIISGGENVHPQEVEAILSTHEQVREVAVVGVPDERWGQIVVAFVVPIDQGLSASVLDRTCRESALADFKRPRAYHFLDALPRNAVGKVLRKTLVDGLKPS